MDDIELIYEYYKNLDLDDIIINSPNIGGKIQFGNYMGKNILWNILDKDSENIFIISSKAITCMPYNEELEYTTWESCSLRRWLNEEFLNLSFSEKELKNIVTTTVNPEKNPLYNTNQGEKTYDKIFLLSISDFNNYYDACNPWVCYTTFDEKKQCWSRTLGNDNKHAVFFGRSGSIHHGGSLVDSERNAVRPVLWLKSQFFNS